jgi:hypothetical protein
MQDIWIKQVYEYLKQKNTCSISEILTICLGYRDYQIMNCHRIAVRNLLSNLGWFKSDSPLFVTVDGKKQRAWIKSSTRNEVLETRIPYSSYFINRDEIESCEIEIEPKVNEKNEKLIEAFDEIAYSLKLITLEIEGIKALLEGK